MNESDDPSKSENHRVERVFNEKRLLYYTFIHVIGFRTFTHSTCRFLCQVFQLLSVSIHPVINRRFVRLFVRSSAENGKSIRASAELKACTAPSSAPIIEHFRRGELNRISVKCLYVANPGLQTR